MACNELISETPATVANRFYNLILSFPSAATGGVEWKILVRTYNELHSTQLDIAALGHSSPLFAAHVLLGDALRLVDKNETNPVVAIEDRVAMTVQPGAPATWPSLYKSLFEIVSEHGSKKVEGHGASFTMLVSQLKPCLLRHGRGHFDETSWSYITKQGKRVRVKKMKHLLQALMEWREECIAWRAEGRPTGCSELDQVLKPRFELLVSKEHHDMLLRCLLATSSTASDGISSSPEIQVIGASESSVDCDVSSEPPPFEYCDSVEATPLGSTAVPSEFGFCFGSATPQTMASSCHSQAVPAKPTTYTTWVWDGKNGQLCSMVPMWYVNCDRGMHNVTSGAAQQALLAPGSRLPVGCSARLFL